MSAKATDLEAQPLTKPETDVEDDLNPDLDKELRKNGGQFDSKFAFFQVTIRLPLDPNPLNLIALAWGFVPFLIPGWFFVYWAVTRRFIPLYGLCLSISVSLINEVILKPIVRDPRPRLSANREQDSTGKWAMKPGMPSGHVLNSTVLLVWALLEVAFKGPGLEEHPDITIKWFLVIILLMGPTPWARWYNSDHSLSQCLVAGSLGLLIGIAAYYVRATYFKAHWAPWHLQEMNASINSAADMIVASTHVVTNAVHHLAASTNITQVGKHAGHEIAAALADVASNATAALKQHHKLM